MAKETAGRHGRILIVDDEPDMISGLRQLLKRRGYEVETALNAEEALDRLKDSPIDLVLTDLMLPGMSGIELLEEIKGTWPDVFVVLFTGFATVENAVQAIRKGAFDYISKPFTPQQLEVVVSRVFRHKALADENRSLRRQIKDRFRFDKLISRSEAMKKIITLLSKVAGTDASILIIGESGTGKELIARAIHANSRRQNKAFIPLDCAALPQALIESELFGYERGAFTGAATAKTGLLEAAHGGTFFLDEVGELDPSIQVKFLRVLQERQFRRVGGTRTISVNVRIVAATNRDLEREARNGHFREDLYHRLNVIQVRLPPLRERHGDIPLLARHFLEQLGARERSTPPRFAEEAMLALERYPWPGNVRELQNAIEYAVSLAESDRIGISDLPPPIREFVEGQPDSTHKELLSKEAPTPSSTSTPAPVVHHELPYKQAKRLWLDAFEKEYFTKLLKRHDFNISKAAIAAEIDRKSIQRILKKNKFGINELAGEERPRKKTSE